MKVQMTYSVNLEEVLKSLSKRLDSTKEEVDAIPRLLDLCSQLLSEGDDEIIISALGLLQKAQKKISNSTTVMTEVENMLSNYVDFMMSSQQEVAPTHTETSKELPPVPTVSNVWDPETKTYKIKENDLVEKD